METEAAPDGVLECEGQSKLENAPARVETERSPWFEPVADIPREVARAVPFPHPRLRAIPREGDTEDLLNGLIAECHFLMREVALPTAIQVNDATTRAQFLGTAMSLAETGAKVGRIVAKLRGAGSVTEIRQRHISEQHVVNGPAPQIENGAKT